MCVLCRATRFVLGIAAVLLACQLINSAEGTIRDGGIDPSNLGKGDWIYQMNSLTVTGAVFQYIDPETSRASRFYRARVLP